MNQALLADSAVELDSFLREFALGIHKRGLAVAAIFFLEMHKPLTGLLHAVVQVSAPLMNLMVGSTSTVMFSRLLNSRENIEKLICLLESLQNGEDL